MKKKHPNTTDSMDTRVLRALDNPNWQYRTASGIAKETRIEVPKVEDVLRRNTSSVRVSLAKAADGSTLFASKKKVSAVSDAWTAFKAVNKAKYGG